MLQLHSRRFDHSSLQRFLPMLSLLLLSMAYSSLTAQDADASSLGTSVLVEIQLPIQNNNIGSITRALDTAIDSVTKSSADNQRPMLLLRFLPTVEGEQLKSDFGACNTLESFLSSPSLTRQCRTVAVLDGPFADHALLPALACSKLIVSPETLLTSPEEDASKITPEMREDYQRVAKAHQHLPNALLQAWLDPAIALHEVVTEENTLLATGQERQQLLDEGKLSSSTAISMAGDALAIDRTLLERNPSISIVPTNDATLAAELDIAPTRFLKSSGPIGDIHAVVVDMSRLVGLSRIRDKQTLINQLADDHNLIIFQFQNDGAHAEELIDLANTIADLRRENIKTVAFVEQHARGAAGMLALACDEIYLAPEATIGGYGNSDEIGDLTFELQQVLEALGHTSLREWSLFYSCLDPTIELYTYSHTVTGETRAFCQQQYEALEDKAQWTRGTLLNSNRHFDPPALRQVGHLQGIASNLAAVLSKFDLTPADIEVKATTGLSGILNEVADSNWFLWATLTMAIYGLIAELASPGLGFPGLLSLLGFGLHIWARHLNGTVAALEIILILIGVIGIAVELFVTPGFGLFGIGGAIALAMGLVLSAQSFSIPSNPFQVQQLANSITAVVGTTVGAIVLYQVTIRAFGDTWLGRTIAPPNNDVATIKQNSWNEALVHWEHLLGKTGQTTTRLSPAGKVRFESKVYDVVSDGDMIAASTQVKVVEVTGNRIVVTEV